MTIQTETMGQLTPKGMLNAVHHSMVFNRRIRILSERLAQAIPGRGRVLDLGCGDGSIAKALMSIRRDLDIIGVDVKLRPRSHIPVTLFDGKVLPFDDQSMDYVMIVDVLHHTEDPAALLSEACRVARHGVVIKDHLLEGFASGATLRLMDWLGNRGHDVALPYNYLSRSGWEGLFRRVGCTSLSWEEKLGLYPVPASLLFDRRLHFITLMAPDHSIAG